MTKTRVIKILERAFIFTPILSSTFVVAASNATQQTSQQPQTTNEWLVIVGGLVTFFLEMQRRRSAENTKRIKETAESTPDLNEFNKLKRHIDDIEDRHKSDIDSLTVQIDMLVSNYKSATVERDRARDGLETEVKLHKETKRQLEEEKVTTTNLFITVEKLETRINELERRIEKSESINELAHKIISGIDGLISKTVNGEGANN